MYEYNMVKDNDGLLCLKKVGDETSIEYDLDEIIYYLNEEKDMSILNIERSYILTLDNTYAVTGLCMESSGDKNSCGTYIREAISFILLMNASKYIMFHNHPNGSIKLSDNDIKSINNMELVTNMLGVDLLDNIVIGKNGYYSQKQNIFKEYNDAEFII